ncbi:MAG: NAD(P)-dependent oxidoreductase [Bacteroidota bacterium]
MNVLVTGGSGLVGKYVVDILSQTRKVSVLDIREPASPKPFYWVDVMNLPALVGALGHGFDAIVHMAGIPNPLNDPAEKVFAVNTVGTFNVLEAAARCGIKKLVFVSSESVLGFAFMTRSMAPDYVPIDEKHPLRPQDPYGLSKLLAEQICRSYSLRYGIQTVCIRPPWIWVPEEKEIEMYRGLVNEYPKWSKNLWAYVHVFDFASAILLALEANDLNIHEVFFVSAKENWTGSESRALLKLYYPNVTEIDESFGGYDSFISSARASAKLGYVPKHNWRELVNPSTR